MYRFTVLFILFSAYSLVTEGQDIHHWQSIENTPGTKAIDIFYFRDGGIASYIEVTGELAISDDKGLTWNNGETSSEFQDLNKSSLRQGLNGNLYFTADFSFDLYEIDRQTLKQRKVLRSTTQLLTYAVSDLYLFSVEKDSLIKRALSDGSIVDSYSLQGKVAQIQINEDKDIICLFVDKSLLLLSEDFEEKFFEDEMAINNARDLVVSPNSILVEPYDNRFQYSLDLGQSWHEVDVPGAWRFDQVMGNADYYVNLDSTIYIFDLSSGIWKDTIYFDSYLNLRGASDALYVLATDRKYNSQLFYAKDDSGFTSINTEIGPPNIQFIKALDSNSCYLQEFELLHHNGTFRKTERFDRIHKFCTGELIATTQDDIYFSEAGDENFEIRQKPTSVRDGITKSELDQLFIFVYNGVYISTDKGLTWTHECPNDYFPAFDILERTVQPKVSKIYYAFAQSRDKILSYNHNTDRTSTSFSYSGNIKTIEDFRINPIGNLFVTVQNNTSGQVEFLRKSSGRTDLLTIPNATMNPHFAMSNAGQLYIHNGESIYTSLDRGESWVDMTGDLPEHIIINRISVADDGTVYLGCAGGNVHKHIYGDLISGTTDNTLSQIDLSPNPAWSSITISRPGNSKKESAQIIDLSGRQHGTFELSSEKDELDISHLVSGIYFILLKDGTGLRFVME